MDRVGDLVAERPKLAERRSDGRQRDSGLDFASRHNGRGINDGERNGGNSRLRGDAEGRDAAGACGFDSDGDCGWHRGCWDCLAEGGTVKIRLVVGWQCSDSDELLYWSQIVEIPVLPIAFELKDFWQLEAKDAPLHYLLPQNIYEMVWEEFKPTGLAAIESDEIMRKCGFVRDNTWAGDDDEVE